jgi:hypothetical protein
MTATAARPDFRKLASRPRDFKSPERSLIGHVPTIAITPVADGRTGAYEDNNAKTWAMVEKVYDLIAQNVALPDGTPVRVVVAPEIVYAPARVHSHRNINTAGCDHEHLVSRSWAYSDELMSACQGIGSSEWQQAALSESNRPSWRRLAEGLAFPSSPIDFSFCPRSHRRREMRGKLPGVGSVSMGIIGSGRNTFLHHLGMAALGHGRCEGPSDSFYDRRADQHSSS